MKLTIAIANSRRDKIWKNIEWTWPEFIERVRNTIRTAETVEQYKTFSKAKQDDIKDVGGFVLGTLKGGSRKKDCVLTRSALSLDMDYAVPGIIDQIELLFSFQCYFYSTHKHMPEKPRLRLIIPLAREVSPDEYSAVARKVAEEIGIELFDDTTYDTNRLMYWPSTSSDGEFVFHEVEGERLNPDEVLAKYKDWRNLAEWPVSKRQQSMVRREVKTQADPLEKHGTVGAFCRAYAMPDAMDLFLADVYRQSAMPGRYDYISADSQAGVVIYDDKYAYSHHATDPACSKLLNAFDMVRIHKFGDLDEKGSFNAMCEFAVKQELVNDLLLEERRERASQDFSSDWTKVLQRDRGGNLMNNLQNITLILSNDPALKAVVFNQLADGLEIKGEVPWKHPARFWRDADDAQLISYVDSHYGTFSARNYEIAITKVADDRSYHPIREYLNNLPPWDGVQRVETLLTLYLGAEDNRYARAVMRKTLCAAIVRVLDPGVKFDSMLVLNGPQGVGKSTFIGRLGGEWYSDSLALTDMNDKTAAEKLQGYWIMEIGELAGMKKAEIDKVKAFISRQDDKYRASFGRRVTPHPRQCVFFGTTNSEKGYLRDSTGNRRFWTVKTPGGASRKTWQLTDEEVKQIWAEALVYVKAGEKLYLDADLEKIAKLEQREAMEHDDREGLVREYLDTLLPTDWAQMDLLERRNFLNGSDFGSPSKEGVIRRTLVSHMEIWCECFGKERSNLRRMDTNEIATILTSIGGWVRQEKKERIPIYGPQLTYAPEEVSK